MFFIETQVSDTGPLGLLFLFIVFIIYYIISMCVFVQPNISDKETCKTILLMLYAPQF